MSVVGYLRHYASVLLVFLLRLCDDDCTAAGAGRNERYGCATQADMYSYGHTDCTDVPEGVLLLRARCPSKRFSGVSAMWHWCHRRAAAVPHDKQRPPTHQRGYTRPRFSPSRENKWSRPQSGDVRMRLVGDAERALNHVASSDAVPSCQ
jgi:hypothetical protein